MFLIKDIYLITLAVLIVAVFGCMLESIILRRARQPFLIMMVELLVLIPLVCYGITLIIRKVDVISFLYGIYFAAIDFSMLLLLKVTYSLESDSEMPKNGKPFFILYLILASLDSACYLTNNLTHWFFVVEPVYIQGYIYSWTCKLSDYVYIHLGLCLLIVLTITMRLVSNMFHTSKFYRGKYRNIFITVALTLSMNMIYLTFPRILLLDYSLIFYGIFACSVFVASKNRIPKTIRQHLLSIASENISDAVICLDYMDNVIYENKQAVIFKLKSKTEWIDKYLKTIEENINKTEILEMNGTKSVFRIEFRRLRDKRGKYSGCYFRLNNCTNEVKDLEREEYRATHDELTGLYNRNYFFSEMERMLRMDPDVPRYLVSTDIKNFKVINDLFGNEFGDQILKLQAKMLEKARREGVIIGRISGDKFAMLIQKDYFNPEMAIKNTQAVKDFVNEMNIQLQILVGVYEIANPYENVHTMYDKAILAIKNSKEDYNAVISMYDTSLMKKLMMEKNIISEFKYALASEQFCIFLQPQIDAVTGKCIGAEALARWYDPDRGYRQPSEFIKVLEDSGLIYQLDYYLWEKSVQKLQVWQKEGIDFYISINISVRDFYYGNLYDYLVSLVEKYQIQPSKLNLEITESIFIADKKFFVEVITKLRNYGFRIEMDDFGSGYSSLNALKDMPMDVLKIDMAFLQKTENEERARLIISCIVKMSRALGMSVVTEGVETEKQAEFLKEIGVDIFQGYLYSKPIPVDDFEHKYLEGPK
mgnify:CR=1 FL=1